jgi:hypothetical protein
VWRRTCARTIVTCGATQCFDQARIAGEPEIVIAAEIDECLPVNNDLGRFAGHGKRVDVTAHTQQLRMLQFSQRALRGLSLATHGIRQRSSATSACVGLSLCFRLYFKACQQRPVMLHIRIARGQEFFAIKDGVRTAQECQGLQFIRHGLATC